ncbi:MAG: radical SAM protein [Bacilli bacterium]|nr:radical SAM protein [Bacilli bacterium]
MFNIKIKTSDFIHVMVTNRCNRRCPFCFDENRKFGKDITRENFIKIMDKAKENNIREVCILGGEPLLHPDIVWLCKTCKEYGFKTVMTTNYAKPEVLLECDKYLDSINISYYNQTDLPDQKNYTADISLSALIYKGRLDNKKDLDDFIDKYKDRFLLRLATLEPTPRFPTQLCDVSEFLDTLEFDEKVTLFGQIEADIYRGVTIKRHDISLPKFEQPFSFNGHVTGEYDRSWTDRYKTEERGEVEYSSPIGDIRSYEEYDALAKKLHKIYIYDQGDYVCGVLFNKDRNKYIMVKQYRYGIDKYNIEFPGGSKDYVEEAIDAYLREIKEETGYKVSKENAKLLGSFYQNVGNSKGKVYIFYAEVSDNDLGEAELDEFEHVEVVEMNDVELKNYLSKDNYMLTQLIYSKYKELENVK